MAELGEKAEYRVLDDAEYLNVLSDKLKEEAGELDPSDPEALNEIADILEVIDCLIKGLGSSSRQVKLIQAERRRERGSFVKRIFIKELTVEDDDKWADYYASRPDRFTEIN